jgi:hypothetical protein
VPLRPEQERRIQELTALICKEKDPKRITQLARELTHLLSMKVDEMKSHPDTVLDFHRGIAD